MFNLHPDWLLRTKPVFIGVVHCRQGSACRQMVLRELLLLIPVKEVWPRAKGDGLLHPIRQTAPPVQLNPTFAARSILPDLKAVATETEGAVSSHDAAITTPELVAG